MKVRVLYPIAFRELWDGEEPEAGAIVAVDDPVGAALAADGVAEKAAANAKVTPKPKRSARVSKVKADPEIQGGRMRGSWSGAGE